STGWEEPHPSATAPRISVRNALAASGGISAAIFMDRIKGQDPWSRAIVVGHNRVKQFLSELSLLGAYLRVVLLGDRVADPREEFKRGRVVEFRGNTRGVVEQPVVTSARRQLCFESAIALSQHAQEIAGNHIRDLVDAGRGNQGRHRLHAIGESHRARIPAEFSLKIEIVESHGHAKAMNLYRRVRPVDAARHRRQIKALASWFVGRVERGELPTSNHECN